MSLAEETQNKKRRNLMVTTVAIIAAAFLELQIPAISLIVRTSADPAEIAWKFWTVPAVLVLYQIWRWSTDRETRAEYARVGEAHEANYQAVAKRHLTHAIRKHLTGRKTRYKVQITSELPDGDMWNWRKSNLDVAEMYNGRPAPISYAGQTVASFFVRSNDKMQSVSSSFGFVYNAGPSAGLLFHAKAAAHTLWQSPDCQDVAVPWILAPIALGVCGFKIALLT